MVRDFLILFNKHNTDISRVNFTFISKIPKKQDCRMVRDYRPPNKPNAWGYEN